MPTARPSMLDQLMSEWTSRGWDPADLSTFRMELDQDGDASTDDQDSDDDTSTDDTGDGDDGGSDADDTDWKSEAEKLKAEARKWEKRAKTNAKELETTRKSQLSDDEKKLEEAEERGRKAALAQASEKLVGAEIRAALAGIVPDPKAIVEDLNLTKYLDEDGEVDTDAVAALKAKYEALAKPGKPKGSADGGSRGDDKKKKAGSLEEAVQKRLSA